VNLPVIIYPLYGTRPLCVSEREQTKGRYVR